MHDTTTPAAEATYRIGAVARQTGIPVATLRVWERRYGVVQPARGAGAGRRYSRADVQRLSLLKSLVDQGDAIGQVAGLPDAALRERLAAGTAVAAARALPAPARRVAVFGDMLPLQLAEDATALGDVDVVGVFRTEAELEAALARGGVDVLVLELGTLQREQVPVLRRWLATAGARHALVIHGFATRDTLAHLPAALFTLLQAPVDMPALARALARELGRREARLPAPGGCPAVEEEPPAARFSARDLARAAEASPAVKCECPRHLANLILQLSRFETYSAQCEHRNDDDARLHAGLRRATGHARALMETALAEVLAAEGVTPRE